MKEYRIGSYLKEIILDRMNDIQGKVKKINESAYSSNEKLETLQQDIINIGEILEANELEFFVGDLEQCCEEIYNYYCCKEQRYIVALCSMIEQFVKKIEAVNEKKVIVFFPYKASMWDALYSIWKSAKDDDNCCCYVVPIPYFDKDEEGNKIAYCYEGDKYTDEIDVVDFEKWDIKKIYPDIVYIHNPYDRVNKYTEVAEEYFSSNIKKYTRKLVYIPYFVSGDNVEEHFCVLPGVIHSTNVILESEEICAQYKNVYKRVLREKGICVDDELLEKKFLSLGSPKYDMVKLYQLDRENLPQEWKNIINEKKAKSIVIYNTHLLGLLNNTQRYLKKLWDVFEYFKNREDVLLLWRPHPLSMSSIKSHNIDAYEVYKSMVQYYINNRIGIYDDSEDLYRAISLSDAYYGDMSSLVQLYKEAGKNVLIQNTGIDVNGKLEVRAGVCYENAIWFVANNVNGLLEYDIDLKIISKYVPIPWLDSSAYASYSAVIEKGGKLYLIPDMDRNVAVYDIQNDNLTKLQIYHEHEYKNKSKFLSAGIFENYMYMFPARVEEIVKINLTNNEMEYVSEWKKNDSINSSESSYFLYDYIAEEDRIIYAIAGTKYIFFVDLIQSRFEYMEFSKKIRGILKEKERYLLLSYDSEDVYYCDKDMNILKRYTGTNEIPGNCYLRCFCGERYIYLVKMYGSSISIIDKEMESIEDLQINTENVVRSRDMCNRLVCTDKEKLYIYGRNTGKVSVIEQKNILDEMDADIPPKILKEILGEQDMGMCYEKNIGLDYFINDVINLKKTVEADNTVVGEIIHRKIIK